MNQSYIRLIEGVYRAHREAEIRVAKQLQTYWPDWPWTKCLKEGKTIVDRHGINVEIVFFSEA